MSLPTRGSDEFRYSTRSENTQRLLRRALQRYLNETYLSAEELYTVTGELGKLDKLLKNRDDWKEGFRKRASAQLLNLW